MIAIGDNLWMTTTSGRRSYEQVKKNKKTTDKCEAEDSVKGTL